MKRSILSKLIVALLLAQILCLPAVADIAPDPLSGGITLDIPASKVKTNVSMVRENVSLDLWPDRCVTKATFWLKNTGARERLEVGFPYVTMPNQWGGPGQDDDLRNFKASVADKPIIVNRKQIREKTPYKVIDTTWLVWQMDFGPGETKKVDVSYENKPAAVYMMRTGAGGGIGGGEYYGPLLERLNLKQIGYKLYTGAHWQGPIEICDLALNVQAPLKFENLTYADPPPTKRTESGFSWHFVNLYQKRNPNISPRLGQGISVEFAIDKTLPAVLSIVDETSRRHPADPNLIAYWASFLDFAGRKQEKLNLYSSFLTTQMKSMMEDDRDEFTVRPIIYDTFALADELKSPQVTRNLCPKVKPLLELYMRNHKSDLSFGEWKEEFARMQNIVGRCARD